MYKHHFLFGRKNYILMLIGIITIFTGYLLMSGGASSDPNIYPEDVIYGFRRTILGPLVCLLGFGIQIAAIFMPNDSTIEYQREKEVPIIKNTAINNPPNAPSAIKPISPSAANMPKKK